jgi:hypothetical protein
LSTVNKETKERASEAYLFDRGGAPPRERNEIGERRFAIVVLAGEQKRRRGEGREEKKRVRTERREAR